MGFSDLVPLKLSRGWGFWWANQWPGVFRPKKYNWVDFTLIQFEIEHERSMANWNGSFAFLGFCFGCTYCYYDEPSDSAGDGK